MEADDFSFKTKRTFAPPAVWAPVSPIPSRLRRAWRPFTKVLSAECCRRSGLPAYRFHPRCRKLRNRIVTTKSGVCKNYV